MCEREFKPSRRCPRAASLPDRRRVGSGLQEEWSPRTFDGGEGPQVPKGAGGPPLPVAASDREAAKARMPRAPAQRRGGLAARRGAPDAREQLSQARGAAAHLPVAPSRRCGRPGRDRRPRRRPPRARLLGRHPDPRERDPHGRRVRHARQLDGGVEVGEVVPAFKPESRLGKARRKPTTPSSRC